MILFRVEILKTAFDVGTIINAYYYMCGITS